MNILLTGAHGFVGQALQPSLAAAGHTIAVIARDHPEAAFAQMQHCDCVIHLAGRAHVMHETATDVYAAYAEVNVTYTLAIARLAKQYRVKRFVFLSSIKVNGESSQTPFTEQDTPQPLDAYGQTKLAAEQALQAFFKDSGTELVIIRPPLIYGPGVKANFRQLIKLCSHPLPLPLGAIHNRRSFVSLQNLNSFIALCCQHPAAANQTFLISDDQDVSISTLVRMIGRALQRRSLLLPIPAWVLRVMFCLTGRSTLAQRLLDNLQLDISKAKTVTGWRAVMDMQQAIAHTVIQHTRTEND